MESKKKYNLHDVTFLIPVRIDSEERMANFNTVIKLVSRDFDTKIIVLEAGDEQRINQNDFSDRFSYNYIYDIDPVYYKTRYVNQLLRMADTKYAIVWDVDVIAIPYQVNNAVVRLRNHEAFLAFPYDGRVFSVNNLLSDKFRQTHKYDILVSNTNIMNLMYGYYSKGGAYIVDRNEFLKIGGENENIYGWGPEDQERVVRIEILDLRVHFEQGGGLFHLWHPRKNNSWFANNEIEINNRKEFLYTCQSNKRNIIHNVNRNVSQKK